MDKFSSIATNPFELPIQLRLADTDSLGHINNAAFIKYLETARTKWHAHIRGNESLENFDWILGGVSVIFRKEAYLSDDLTVHMWCSRIGTKSWDFSYAITNQKNELVLEGKSSQIAFDYEAKQTQAIPDDLLLDLKERLGSSWASTV